MRRLSLLLLGCLNALVADATTAVNRSSLLTYASKPRVFVLSDISNEPDDTESFVRFLLYSNQFQIEGMTAVTSTWLKDSVYPEQISAVVDAYAEVVDNLNQHTSPSSPYPSAEYLHSVVKSGPAVYGMQGVGPGQNLSSGAELLLNRLRQPVDEPLWVLGWGGVNVLAETLYYIQHNFNATEAARLRGQLRVYTISDQDDSGLWIREQFPDIFYIASMHGWNQYGLAAWAAISGEEYYNFDVGGPDFTKVSAAWLKKNIQIGTYGKEYPDYKFIMEGDTPTFLYLIQNGLGVREQPDYGSWGGRYSLVDLSQQVKYRQYSDAADRVIGQNNRTYTSNHAAIWRWRDAYQNDFAARMQWALPANESKANHHPVVMVNEHADLTPLVIASTPNATVTLDASGTYDPDRDSLSFRWFQYKEPGSTDWNVDNQIPTLNFTVSGNGQRAQVTIPGADVVCDGKSSNASGCWTLHLVLEVTDHGAIPLTTYKRVLFETTNTTRSE
ncbi:DUF1593-domain-containing protein [Aspergillus brunneoviolaceus CBS 621.78]|uniref:DUF1593-domain-containing protein n=1 Tax=Aspergillus brunneoviolaceus CBS 621.78 TaxID=1450534 RepID=A0ACD1FSY2_9EURO|nr:DUF1593-domain-containing protein [Aspergillus brunneoviolaceus CBS 621.78]RAH40020.1 DUF1593-domain-containing protein [Aspergillus brunneoviolaceus CBS 621.78]